MKAQGEGVLVTGCSSGIGKATAIHLARQGYTVFATVRRESDADALRNLNDSNLIPVCPLDLTHRDDIPRVVEMVSEKLQERGQEGLRAVVNNAGGGGIAPVELMDVDDFSQEMEARVVGTVALLQAVLPMIRQAEGGRLVWIVTPAIIPTPYVASIHAADFAVNCLARTLQLELKPWAIPSVMIRCGGIQTPAAARTMEALKRDLDCWPRQQATLYQRALRKWMEQMADFDARRASPDKVAEVVHRAIRTPTPRSRYSVGYMAGAAALLEWLPQPLGDAILSMRY